MPYPTTGRPKGRPSKVAKALPTQGYASSQVPDPPAFLELYGRRLQAWGYLWAQCPWLDASKGDGVLVGQVAFKLIEVQDLRERLAKNGTQYLAANGQWAAKPEVRQLEAAEAQLTAWLAALGLSPADRSRLSLTATGGHNKLLEYRARHEVQNLGDANAFLHPGARGVA